MLKPVFLLTPEVVASARPGRTSAPVPKLATKAERVGPKDGAKCVVCFFSIGFFLCVFFPMFGNFRV